VVVRRSARNAIDEISGRPVDDKQYILDVIDKTRSEKVLAANGSADAVLNGELAVLFDAAMDAATKRALDFLDAIIPPTV
jgi:hypothetical protein